MGNCQAVDAAALVILHPNGKQERMYWPVPAAEIMKSNPGHYVSLIIPIPVSGDENKTVRFTRVKLLRPTDTLVLGRAYRLVTTEEVMQVIKAKKQAKMRKIQQGSDQNVQMNSKKYNKASLQPVERQSEAQKNTQVTRIDRHQQRLGGSTNLASGKPKTWRPSLQSISESAG